MKIMTLVEMTDADIGEAITEWAKRKFKKKDVGDIELAAVDLGSGAPITTGGDGYVIRAKFELSDKKDDDSDEGRELNR